jgi:hypothetical protein
MALTTKTNAFSTKAEFFCQIPSSINNYILAAGAAQNIDVADLIDADGVKPTMLSFAATGDFFVKWNGTAVDPIAALDGTGQELNPAQRLLDSSINSFSIIATADCVLSLAIFSKMS